MGVWAIVGMVLVMVGTLQAADYAGGYRDSVYRLIEGRFCEQRVAPKKGWCVGVDAASWGLVVAFNHAIVYGDTVIQGIDLTRRRVMWQRPLAGVNRMAIGYPVIVVARMDGRLMGLDFFNGYTQWERQVTGYKNVVTVGDAVWVQSGEQWWVLDRVTGDWTRPLPIRGAVTDPITNGEWVFFWTDTARYMYHTTTHDHIELTDGLRLVAATSTLMELAGPRHRELRDYRNRVISANVGPVLIPVNGPQKSQFMYQNDRQLTAISPEGLTHYEFTATQNYDIIDYAYRVGNTVWVIYPSGQDVWTLTLQKTQQFDHDI
jgi:hypothetical protein